MSTKYTAVTTGLSGAGVIAWWEMAGRIDPEALEEALADAGLNIKVPRTSMIRALAQAVRKVAGKRASKTHGVFAVAGPRGAWFLVERTLIDAGLDLSLASLCRIEIKDDEFVIAPLNGADTDPAKAAKLSVAYHVVGAAEMCALTTASSQTSTWLSGVHMKQFSGVSLRTAGGFYFIPAAVRSEWETFWGAVQSVTANTVSSIDAMPTEETIATVAAALRRECETAIDLMAEEVSDAKDTGMHEKSRKSRVAAVKAIKRKLDRYRDLLGASLDDVAAAADDVAVNLAVLPGA